MPQSDLITLVRDAFYKETLISQLNSELYFEKRLYKLLEQVENIIIENQQTQEPTQQHNKTPLLNQIEYIFSKQTKNKQKLKIQ